MQYISTRGGIAPVSFQEAVMMGLADDGGLLLPAELPEINEATIESWRKLDYPDLAFNVLSLFATDIPANDLEKIVKHSYAAFNHPEVTPVIRRGDLYILELFHGPTFAFKDVALQFLGNIFEYLLEKSGGKMNIIGDNSGDTGSAAIYGVRGKERINIFILHPHKRVSPIQELQMTTVTDHNVHNIAIRGTFDDGQAIVKAIFNDINFKEKFHLGAVNSINWARIVAQVVYYIYAALLVTGKEGVSSVDFSVPTGNFGDIFAGFIARRLLAGRIRKLVLATNENNLLSRFVEQGDYSLGDVVQTVSPSMDIQLASNFERYLYFLHNQDAARTAKDMAAFAATGALKFDDQQLKTIQADFCTASINERSTLEVVRAFYKKNDYILDPHTAVGVGAAEQHQDKNTPMICLATAHPAKFGEAVERAVGHHIQMPAALDGLASMESRCEVLDAEIDVVKQFVEKRAV